MRSLHRAIRSPSKGGVPLPLPFKSFAKYDIAIRKGEVTMVVGPPGAGKSTIALAMAMNMRVPTLYLSMDSGEDTMGIRALAMITGKTTREVEASLEVAPERGAELLREHSSHIKWEFDAESLWDLEEEIDIYTELMGSNPELVVIDNATDLSHENGDEYGSLRSLLKELKRWSRTSNSAFLVLHHTSESFDSVPCPPLRSVHGKVNQKPATVLSIGDRQGNLLPIAPVKNRGGASDKSGQSAVWLYYDPATMTLKDVDQ